MIHLNKKQKIDFYTSLLTKNFIEAGRGCGLGAIYNTENSIRSNSYALYKTLKPHELGISEDVIKAVQEAIQSRRITPRAIKTEGEGGDILDPTDTKQLVVGGRNKAAMLLHKKFDQLMRSPSKLEDVSLSQLATTFGILFDKSQILRGEATENIAVMAKIDSNMSPEESMEALLNMRETLVAEKHQ